jgi:hypothetical protein
MNFLDKMQQPVPDIPGRIHLEECPKCEYSLKGLPASHRCPECGFEYDDRTFVLMGIARGTTGMSTSRKVLWGIAAAVPMVGPQVAAVVLVSAGAWGALLLPLGVLWVGLVVYLFLTGRRERRGAEKFVFVAGGFGYCADLTPTGVTHARMMSWDTVDTVVVDRKGSNWHRIRIGSGRGLGGRLRRVRFDVGVRCDVLTAAWIREVLAQRIDAARQTGQAIGPGWGGA